MDTLQDSAAPDAIARSAEQLGCRSIAFTYNDPVIFAEYAIDVAKACRDRGIKTVAVTAGYMCDEPRREFYQYIDAANVDLKGFTEDFYYRICGGQLSAGARDARLPQARNHGLVRDHHTADSRERTTPTRSSTS